MAAGQQAGTSLRRLTKRSEFLRAARGSRAGRSHFALQSVAVETEAPGIGLTVSRKVGNSPQRSRVKRRLRAAVRACAGAFRAQHDYVLVGRHEALAAPFSELVADLQILITRVEAMPPTRHRPKGRRNKGQ